MKRWAHHTWQDQNNIFCHISDDRKAVCDVRCAPASRITRHQKPKIGALQSWERNTGLRQGSLTDNSPASNTCNRALWPRGKATDLKSVPVAEVTDSKSVEASGRRFESYRCHSFCILLACFRWFPRWQRVQTLHRYN